MYHNHTFLKAGIVMLVLDKIEFRAIIISKDKEDHFIMIIMYLITELQNTRGKTNKSERRNRQIYN